MAVAVWASNPVIRHWLGLGWTRPRRRQAGGNMEGKETRFGVVNSALFAAVTTATSCGAVNAMHDSFPARRPRTMWLTTKPAKSFSAASAPASTACWSWPSSRCSSPG
jgi:K+-transporting ATPase A subunit